MKKKFGILFILTGIFAIAGGLYTWGDGSIFSQTELLKVLIPWADVLLTGPLSLLSGYAILKKLSWAKIFGLLTSGIYLLGSVLVFITIAWNSDYSIFLIVPSVSGFLIAIGFTVCVLREKSLISFESQIKHG